jgi:hypothetical protein
MFMRVFITWRMDEARHMRDIQMELQSPQNETSTLDSKQGFLVFNKEKYQLN